MNSLDQIESAVAELPPQQKRSLLSWLQDHLAAGLHSQTPERSSREKWLEELSALRSSTAAGAKGVPLQQLMDDLREDRC